MSVRAMSQAKKAPIKRADCLTGYRQTKGIGHRHDDTGSAKCFMPAVHAIDDRLTWTSGLKTVEDHQSQGRENEKSN